MNPSNTASYRLLTNGALVVAVLSSLLFDRLGALQWVAGGTAAAAALLAVTTYFRRHSSESRGVPVAESEPERSGLEQHAPGPVRVAAEAQYYYYDFKFVQVARQPQRYDFAETVAHLIKRLASTQEGPSYEFVLTTEGDFHIRRLPHTEAPSEAFLTSPAEALSVPGERLH